MELNLGKELLYLSKKDVANVNLSMAEIIDLVEYVYTEKGKGNTIMPCKMPMHPIPNSMTQNLTAMPACIFGRRTSGVKFIGGYSTNYAKGLDYIYGLQIVTDIDTGIPVAVMDCNWVTAMRTSAVTGLGARYLANKDSHVVCIIGCGAQGRNSVDALFCELKEIKKIYAMDVVPASLERFIKSVTDKYNVEVVPITNLEDAIRDSDIVVSGVPSDNTPEQKVIPKGWLKSNATVFPVDLGVTFFEDAISDEVFDKSYTDDHEQFLHFQKDNFLVGLKKLPIEFGDMLTGKFPARENHEERIVSVPPGTGLADLITAHAVYERALELGIGTILPL